MTVDRHPSFLHGEGHDLDHVLELAHRRVPVVLQREIVIVNCNRVAGSRGSDLGPTPEGDRVVSRLLLRRYGDFCFHRMDTTVLLHCMLHLGNSSI